MDSTPVTKEELRLVCTVLVDVYRLVYKRAGMAEKAVMSAKIAPSLNKLKQATGYKDGE